MNYNDKRKIMFGEKAVIEMDIDPAVSNLDTPTDIKVPFFALNNRTGVNAANIANEKDNMKNIKENVNNMATGCENAVK